MGNLGFDLEIYNDQPQQITRKTYNLAAVIINKQPKQ